jgi:hypothetical protein
VWQEVKTRKSSIVVMKFKALAAGIALASLFSYSASAVTLNTVYTGATPESILRYEQNGTLLKLYMEHSSTTTEFISNWGFNLDKTLDPLLPAGGISINGLIDVATPSIDIPGAPSLNPLSFHFSLGFQTSAGDGRFQPGNEVWIDLPAGFNVTGSGAHVQGIGPNGEDSGKVTVPEPSAALASLLALGLGVALRRRMA